MGLTATTTLGDNAIQMLEGIAAALRADGVEIEHRLPSERSSAGAANVLRGVDLGWACGLLATDLIEGGDIAADVVAAPVFEGQARSVYHSVIVARRSGSGSGIGDHRHGRLVINERGSWSGHYALSAHFVDRGLPLDGFGSVALSGSHQQSIAALLADEADVAAVDHTVWRHIADSDGISEAIEVIDRTCDWPAPPFFIDRSLDAGDRARLLEALTAIPGGRVPGLTGVVAADGTAYHRMRERRSTLPSLV